MKLWSRPCSVTVWDEQRGVDEGEGVRVAPLRNPDGTWQEWAVAGLADPPVEIS